MRKLLLFVACCLTMMAHAQESPVTVEGDLNKDGIMDKVVASLIDEESNKLAIYFGDGKGGYTLFRECENLLSYDKLEITINDKGVLRIQEGPTGCCDVFLFRFQDDDFRCIGGKIDRHTDDHYDISYNYLTGMMVSTEGEGKAKKSVTSEMPEIPVLKFGWFPLKYDELDYLVEENDFEDQLEFKTIRGLFQLLPNNDFLSDDYELFEMSRLFYNWRNLADGTWTIGYEILRPSDFNVLYDLTITKQDDGSYRFLSVYDYMDRRYEQYLDEDGDNLDEAIERAEKEGMGPTFSMTETVWLFKDGIFTMVSQTHEE